MSSLDGSPRLRGVRRRFASATDEPLQSVAGRKATDGVIVVDKDTPLPFVEKLERLAATGILTELGPEKEKT